MKAELYKLLKQDSRVVAPLLLGWKIVRNTPQGKIKLKIVETEAYHQTDPASHSFRGPTNRTAAMFETGGRLYVYFTYGMHYCINIVTGPKGVGEGVLIRAGEPLSGIEMMKKNRRTEDILNIANGPGKLAQALGIASTELSGEPLNELTIYLVAPDVKIQEADIVVSPRIGIKKAADEPLRFYLKKNKYISRT